MGIKKGSAAMLAAKRSAGDPLEMNLRNPLHTVNKACKECFETQDRCHQKSKIGVSVAPQKRVISSKILKQPL